MTPALLYLDTETTPRAPVWVLEWRDLTADGEASLAGAFVVPYHRVELPPALPPRATITAILECMGRELRVENLDLPYSIRIVVMVDGAPRWLVRRVMPSSVAWEACTLAPTMFWRPV